jgi:hypothetical protein
MFSAIPQLLNLTHRGQGGGAQKQKPVQNQDFIRVIKLSLLQNEH